MNVPPWPVPAVVLACLVLMVTARYVVPPRGRAANVLTGMFAALAAGTLALTFVDVLPADGFLQALLAGLVLVAVLHFLEPVVARKAEQAKAAREAQDAKETERR